MNQKQLQYFLEVYSTKSITKAARNLYISPQGLSKTILSLEKELGVELFERKNNHIIPTSEAARLSIHAKNILEEYHVISEGLYKNDTTFKTISVFCSYDVPQLIPARFFYQFNESFPEIRINMKEFTDEHIIKRLQTHKVELAIVPGPFNPNLFNYELLCSEPFCVVVNKDHPLADREVISFSALNKERLVIKDVRSQTSLNQYYNLSSAKGIPNIILETSDIHLIHKMAEEGPAVGMSLLYLARKIRSDRIKILTFEEDWLEKKVYLVTSKNNVLSPEAKILRSALLDYFQNTGA